MLRHDFIFPHSTAVLQCNPLIMGMLIPAPRVSLATYFQLDSNSPVKTGLFGPNLEKNSTILEQVYHAIYNPIFFYCYFLGKYTMVRHYKPRIDAAGNPVRKKLDGSNLQHAIDAVRTNTLSQRQAAVHYGIARATLQRYLDDYSQLLLKNQLVIQQSLP